MEVQQWYGAQTLSCHHHHHPWLPTHCHAVVMMVHPHYPVIITTTPGYQQTDMQYSDDGAPTLSCHHHHHPWQPTHSHAVVTITTVITTTVGTTTLVVPTCTTVLRSSAKSNYTNIVNMLHCNIGIC